MNDVDTQAKLLLNRTGSPKRRAVLRVSPLLNSADHQMVGQEGVKVATWHLEGERYQDPPVLLVHGWEDDTSLWTPLIEMLNRRGRSVVAFDLPGHGYSQGEACDLDLAAQAIADLDKAFGPFGAVATHSFGGPALCKALLNGFEVPVTCLISPPVDQARQFERSWRRHEVPEPLIEAGLKLGRAEAKFFDLAEAAKQMTAEALFVHSMDDEQCPASEGKRASEAWPGARFYPVEDLGHRKLVQNDDVVALVAAWLDG